jgi:plastocyanin
MKLRFALASILLVALAACGSSYSAPTTPSTGGTNGGNNGGTNTPGTPVSIVSGASLKTTTAFAPTPVVISAGGTVTWTNNDNTSHTSSGDDGSWNSGSIAPGAQFSRTFPSAGSFPYHCAIHPGMVGTVTVQ